MGSVLENRVGEEVQTPNPLTQGARSLVDDLYLLSHTFLVYCLVDFLDELGVHAAEGALCAALVENLVVALCLQHGHVMLFLVLSYLTAHAHALCEDVHHLVVELVDLLAQLADALGGDGVVAYDEE